MALRCDRCSAGFRSGVRDGHGDRVRERGGSDYTRLPDPVAPIIGSLRTDSLLRVGIGELGRLARVVVRDVPLGEWCAMRKVSAVLALVAGMSGLFAAAASPASAIPIVVNGRVVGDTDNIERICLRANVVLFGNAIGTGPNKVCAP